MSRSVSDRGDIEKGSEKAALRQCTAMQTTGSKNKRYKSPKVGVSLAWCSDRKEVRMARTE